jgi:hypothetical protein
VRSECTQTAELEAKALQEDKNALEVLSSVDRRNKKGKRKKAAVWMGVCGLLALCLAAYFLLHGEREFNMDLRSFVRDNTNSKFSVNLWTQHLPARPPAPAVEADRSK